MVRPHPIPHKYPEYKLLAVNIWIKHNVETKLNHIINSNTKLYWKHKL